MPKFLSDGHFSGSSADLAVDGVLDVTGKITTLANITTLGVNQFKSVGGTGSAVAIELKSNSSGSNSDYLAKSTIYSRYDYASSSPANNNSMLVFKVGIGADAFQHTVLTLDSSKNATFAGSLNVGPGPSRFTDQQNAGSRLELYNNRQDAGNVEVYRIAAYNAVEVAGVHFYRGGGGNSGYTKIFAKKNNSSSLEEVVKFGQDNSLATTFAGDVTASNLSGTNTGDQDLSGYLTSDTNYLKSNASDSFSGILTGTNGGENLKIGGIRGTAKGSQTGEYIHLYERVHIGGPSGWGHSSHTAPSQGLGIHGSLNVGQNGSGVIAIDDTTIVTAARALTNISDYGLTSSDIPNNAANTSGSAATAAKLTDGGSLTTHPGQNNLLYTGQITAGTAGLFATSDNSNSVITLNRHNGEYNSQLGFSSNGYLYYRKKSNTANNTQAWKVLAFTDSDITGNAATASAVPYSGLTGTVPTWNQNTTGSAGSVAWGNITSRPYIDTNSTTSATATTAIASVAHATYTAAFFDFVIKNGTNVRAGTIYACHDGTNVEFTETSTVDLGDTSDVTLNVVISTSYLQLQATTTSSTWTIKSLIRAI